MISIQKTEQYRQILQESFDTLIRKIDGIRIGTPAQFPFGWRKAAKGRTVWRIIEEVINQNLEKYYEDLGFSNMNPSESEVSVYDAEIWLRSDRKPIFVNFKSAVADGRINKDDISKAEGLQQFFEEDVDKQLFIATFIIQFSKDMKIHFQRCIVMPIAWLPDIYVNPSNNGNLQSSKYKSLEAVVRRTSGEFVAELAKAMKVARKKRQAKATRD
jgi:hypothetical protein